MIAVKRGVHRRRRRAQRLQEPQQEQHAADHFSDKEQPRHRFERSDYGAHLVDHIHDDDRVQHRQQPAVDHSPQYHRRRYQRGHADRSPQQARRLGIDPAAGVRRDYERSRDRHRENERGAPHIRTALGAFVELPAQPPQHEGEQHE